MTKERNDVLNFQQHVNLLRLGSDVNACTFVRASVCPCVRYYCCALPADSSLPHHQLDNEDDCEVGREEAHTALLAVHAHDGLADEGEVHEAAVGVAEGEAKELGHQRVLVLGGGAVVLEVFFLRCCFDRVFVVVDFFRFVVFASIPRFVVGSNTAIICRQKNRAGMRSTNQK